MKILGEVVQITDNDVRDRTINQEDFAPMTMTNSPLIG